MKQTVRDFCADYEAMSFINTKQGVEEKYAWLKKKLEIVSYLPFAEKRELCANVLNACNTKDNNGLVKVDSVSRYIIFTLSIISKYTNLEFSSGEDDEFDSLDEYDMLCKANLLDSILDVIGAEYTTCNNILNMMMSDIVSNNNTIENVVGHTLGKIGTSVDGLISVLAEKVEDMEFDLNQIDIDKYKWLIELFAKK